MLHLPSELQRLCIELLDADVATLKELRLVSHEIGKLATEVLFRIAVLNPTEDSAERFAALIQSEYRQDVRCVVVNDFETEAEVDDPQDELEISESYSEALRSLCKFESLQELRLRFAKDCAAEPDRDFDNETFQDVNQTIEYRSTILSVVCEALQNLKSFRILSIRDLQDHMDRSILESEAFELIRSQLTGLHLQIATEVLEQHDLDFAALHRGFTIDLPELWLKPVKSHLTHLTLYSYTCLWGLYPFVDFREVGTFPHLKSLSLGNWTIAHDWQVEWILSHGSTLKQLLLDDCPIIPALRMAGDGNMARLNFPDLKAEGDDLSPYFKLIPMRWHQVLDRFRSNLSHLGHFALRCSDGCDWSDDAFDYRYDLINVLGPSRYQFFDQGSMPHWLHRQRHEPKSHEFYRRRQHPNPEYWNVDFPDCYEEDMQALGRFVEVVRERKNSGVM